MRIGTVALSNEFGDFPVFTAPLAVPCLQGPGPLQPGQDYCPGVAVPSSVANVPQICDSAGNCRPAVVCKDIFPADSKCSFFDKLLPLYIMPNIVPIGIGLGVLAVFVVVGGRRR